MDGESVSGHKDEIQGSPALGDVQRFSFPDKGGTGRQNWGCRRTCADAVVLDVG